MKVKKECEENTIWSFTYILEKDGKMKVKYDLS